MEKVPALVPRQPAPLSPAPLLEQSLAFLSGLQKPRAMLKCGFFVSKAGSPLLFP